MKHVKCYKKDYPRPQYVRNNWTSLDGKWFFVFDDENIGENNGWFLDFPKNMEIVVPYSYQTKKSGLSIRQISRLTGVSFAIVRKS